MIVAHLIWLPVLWCCHCTQLWYWSFPQHWALCSCCILHILRASSLYLGMLNNSSTAFAVSLASFDHFSVQHTNSCRQIWLRIRYHDYRLTTDLLFQLSASCFQTDTALLARTRSTARFTCLSNSGPTTKSLNSINDSPMRQYTVCRTWL